MNEVNGKCRTDGLTVCQMMKRALGQSDVNAKTGIVQGLFPPHLVAIRCKGAKRGEYMNLIFRLCPWCGVRLPQGRM